MLNSIVFANFDNFNEEQYDLLIKLGAKEYFKECYKECYKYHFYFSPDSEIVRDRIFREYFEENYIFENPVTQLFYNSAISYEKVNIHQFMEMLEKHDDNPSQLCINMFRGKIMEMLLLAYFSLYKTIDNPYYFIILDSEINVCPRFILDNMHDFLNNKLDYIVVTTIIAYGTTEHLDFLFENDIKFNDEGYSYFDCPPHIVNYLINNNYYQINSITDFSAFTGLSDFDLSDKHDIIIERLKEFSCPKSYSSDSEEEPDEEDTIKYLIKLAYYIRTSDEELLVFVNQLLEFIEDPGQKILLLEYYNSLFPNKEHKPELFYQIDSMENDEEKRLLIEQCSDDQLQELVLDEYFNNMYRYLLDENRIIDMSNWSQKAINIFNNPSEDYEENKKLIKNTDTFLRDIYRYQVVFDRLCQFLSEM